jgi:copper homeostasis protein
VPPNTFSGYGIKHNTLKNNIIQLEICAQSLTSALIAQEGGADRIELCMALEVGGLTPSPATLVEARRLLTIDICVLVRPRAGDFFYSDVEFDLIKKDIQFCKEHGMNGIVVGVLTENQEIDVPRMRELAALAKPMQVACHRAFDQTPDAFKAMEQLIDMGYDRILTSGQKDDVVAGKPLLKELIIKANGRIAIMPGNGVRVENMADILKTTGARDIHMTAKQLIVSGKNSDTGSLFNMKNALNNNYYETDLGQVQKAVEIVKNSM